MPPTKLQKDQPQHQRTNQNNGHIHLLCPVRTDHRDKGVTDRLCHRFQMSDDAIQETDNRETQPSRPGRLGEVREGSSRSLEEVTEMEGPTPTKKTRKASKSAAATTSTPKGRGLKGRGKKS